MKEGERIEKEGWRFKNVSTHLGKTHVNGEDGRSIYINVLDIDSEKVFTILSRLSTSTGKDIYFINEACKLTFVSRTKKKYGRHIFWLSHEQHKPIGTRNCKQGTEFEIKTYNSLGLITLPPSKHRDDLQTRYQSLGQNKIEVIERMYEELLQTLDDCLKPKDDESNNILIEKRDTERGPEVILNEEEIRSIFTLSIPYYRKGYRHHIIYGLSGLLYKRSVTRWSTESIVQKLSINDEEKDNRLLTIKNTYNKDPKTVTGFHYLLSIIENVVNGDYHLAKRIIEMIISIIHKVPASNASAPDDVVAFLTQEVMKEFTFITIRDNEEIFYYDVTRGVYVTSADSLIKEYVEILDPKIKTYQVNEIIQKIKRRTYVNRNLFDNDPDIMNVQNGLLNVWNGVLGDHSPDFFSIVQLPLVYNPCNRCPNIARFLAQVLHPEDVLIALKLIGYTLYRTAMYEKAVMLHGNGDNGKGVFIKIIEAFVGPENCSHVALQELDNDKFSSADLYGKLVNSFADLTSQKLLATGNFKTLVSGDSVRAQKKYGQPFSFRNFCKLIFSSNRIPDSDDKSHAYFKRWLVLSFDRVFDGMTKDTNLISKLITPNELSGLLNLALIALRQLKKDGGFKDISVEKVRKEYEYNANTVKAFLDEKCVIDLTSPEYSIPTVYLYNEYENFGKVKQTKPLEMNVFGSKLKEYGIKIA